MKIDQYLKNLFKKESSASGLPGFESIENSSGKKDHHRDLKKDLKFIKKRKNIVED